MQLRCEYDPYDLNDVRLLLPLSYSREENKISDSVEEEDQKAKEKKDSSKKKSGKAKKKQSTKNGNPQNQERDSTSSDSSAPQVHLMFFLWPKLTQILAKLSWTFWI